MEFCLPFSRPPSPPPRTQTNPPMPLASFRQKCGGATFRGAKLQPINLCVSQKGGSGSGKQECADRHLPVKPFPPVLKYEGTKIRSRQSIRNDFSEMRFFDSWRQGWVETEKKLACSQAAAAGWGAPGSKESPVGKNVSNPSRDF